MRRNRNGIYSDEENYKPIILLAGGILLIAIITFIIVYAVYNNKIKSNELASISDENSKISMSSSSGNSIIASSDMGKTVNEMKNNVVSENSGNISNEIVNNIESQNILEESNNKIIEFTTTAPIKEENKTNEETSKLNVDIIEPEKIEEKEPVFEKPIEEGEIYREFAKENLVYSETLQEWITHLGIDIKAPKTTVVMASEAGVVESIKNDPRYGLTVIIIHAKDYKTVYSNLLTSEFVNEGDEVKKGQSIGTVGNTAAFEIADEPHLHFEIIKNNEKVDPSLYIK